MLRFIAYFVVGAASVIAGLLALEYQRFDHGREKLQESESLRLAVASKTIARDMRELRADLGKLSQSQALLDYVADASERNAGRLERQFLNFARHSAIYDQIRYLDRRGHERLRVELAGGAPVAVAPERLQDKSQRYYFQEAIGLPQGRVYLSPLDLNVERQAIERPFKPTIRVATPVYLPGESEPRGILILNYVAAHLLTRFAEVMTGSWGVPMMVNDEGYWLYHPQRDDAWGFMWGDDNTFARRYPHAWEAIRAGESGEVISAHGWFGFATVRPEVIARPTHAERPAAGSAWKLISRVGPEGLNFSPWRSVQGDLQTYLWALLLSAVLSAALARLRTTNIRKAKALRESERTLSEAQKLARLGNWVWDLPSGTLSWSDEIYRVFGLQPQEFDATYEAFLARIHPEDRELVTAAVNSALYERRPYAIDHRILLPDQSVRTVHERGEVQFDRAGNPVRMLGTVQDITERKCIEQALQDNEHRLRELVGHAPDGIFVADLDGRYTDVNAAGCRMLGYRREEIIGKTIEDLLPDAERDRLWQSRKELLQGRIQVAEWTLQRKDGTYLPVEVSAKILPDGRWQGFVRDISDRKQAEEALRLSEERVRLLFESVAEGIVGVDLQGRCTFANPAALRLLGFQDASQLLGQNLHALIHHTRVDGSPCRDEQCRVYRAFREARGFQVSDEVFWRADGSHFDVEYRSHPIFQNGEVIGSVATFSNITERKKAEEKLRQSGIVFASTNEAIMVTDARAHIIMVNDAFTNITGFSAQDVIGKTPRFQKSGRHDQLFYQELWGALQRSGQWQGEIWNRRKNGEVYPAWENINAVRNDQGELVNYVSVFSDISTIKEAEERLNRLAHHDALTGLPNRLLFTASLEQALARAKRHGQQVALLFLDLDRFKLINDTLGHAAGDRLLQTIAERLKASVRDEDLVARLGGDEFTMVLEEISHPEDAAALAQKLIAAVAEPVELEGREVVISPSIGISLYPRDGTNAGDLAKAADAAMYRAKSRGRHTYEFYTTELTAAAFEHLSMESGLRHALVSGELALHYQLQIEVKTGRVRGVEALLRWQHPEFGIILPEQFIPIAEESSLIDAIGGWVLQQACAQARRWRDTGLPALRVAVNLSARQLMHDGLLQTVHDALAQAGLEAGDVPLQLEVTESVLHAGAHTSELLRQLRRLGISIAIDDFGTGYSSLSQLKHLPVDTLKIDRLFVRNIPADADNQAITAAIISMGHTLGLEVVAEGVETEEQLGFLQQHGCDEAQGYLIGEAVPAEAIGALLQRQRVWPFTGAHAGDVVGSDPR